MSIHQNVLTKDISTITSWSPAIADGDTIVTDGYYEAGDGGGASFNARYKGTGETANGVFTYAIFNREELIAELIVENHTVSVEQLGAKSVGSIPYDQGNICFSQEDANKNNSVFNSACTQNNPNFIFVSDAERNLQKLILKKDAIYLLPSFQVMGKSTFCLEGNGATVFQYINDNNASSQNFIQISNCEKASIRNLNIKSISSTAGYVAALYGLAADNIELYNVSIESPCVGINLEGMSQEMFSAKKLRVQAGNDGVFSFDLKEFALYDADIQSNQKGLRLYGTNNCECVCRLNNVRVSGGTTGLNLTKVKDSVFRNITLCDMGQAMSINATNSIFSNITAIRFNKGFSLTDAESILISDALFVSNDVPVSGTASDVLVTSAKGSEHILLKNCLFDFATKWFSVTHSTQAPGSLAFMDCQFIVRQLSDATPYPATIFGGTLNASFQNCGFYAAGFPVVTQGEGNQATSYISNSATMFYFKPSASAVQAHEWVFNNCRFWHDTEDGNGARLVANSLIWVDTQKDQQYAKTHVALTNCFFEDFYWTVRVFTANADQNVNPADAGAPTKEAAQLGAQALENKGRFVSVNNYYQYQMLATDPDSIRPAETYGVTV